MEFERGRTMNQKPDCYKCRYRGTVPGDAHSCCKYPGNKTGLLDFFAPENRANITKLNIKANPHGVMNGWFFYPDNFDPVWLINCDGFTPKDGTEK